MTLRDAIGRLTAHSRAVRTVAALSLLAIFLILGTIPLSRSKIIAPILQAQPDDVISYIVSSSGPMRRTGYHEKWVTDRATIVRVCQALNQATPCSPNHPDSIWRYRFTLRKKDGNHTCMISRTRDSGVLVSFYSRGDWGWHLGDFRSDVLGDVIESTQWSANSP